MTDYYSPYSNISTNVDTSAPLAFARIANQKRNLAKLDAAVAKGDMGSIKTALANAQKSFKTSFGSPSTLDNVTQNTLTNDFNNIAKAITKGDSKAVKEGWTKTKTDLTNSGVGSLTNSPLLAAQALSTANANTNTALANALFGNSSSQSSWQTYSIYGATNSSGGTMVGKFINAWA